MADDRFDVAVVGSGPAGAIAATVLARGGARVALVDKARFPRDKACGDLIGPRGVRLLDDLGIDVHANVAIDDMVVVGPSNRRVHLPCFPGETYPGHAWAVPRHELDALLHAAATDAGAQPINDRLAELTWPDGGGHDRDAAGRGPVEVTLGSGARLRADFVIGADGATSRVAECAGLVDATRVLWGFAVRSYVEDPVTVPHIVFWDTSPRRGLPGYGWLFPGPGGCANVGLGVGVLGDRSAGAAAARLLPDFIAHLARTGVLERAPSDGVGSGRLGGWLKMGMVGTTPAAGRVLLVGDAAGLVNPLQGEGIAQAMATARAAAQAVLDAPADAPADAAARYRSFLRETYAAFHGVTATVHRALLPRPRAVSAVGRTLTAPGVSRVIAGGWSLFWNDLLAGAPRGSPRAVASTALLGGRAVTSRSRSRRWLAQALDG